MGLHKHDYGTCMRPPDVHIRIVHPVDDPSPTRVVNMLPPEMHDIKSFIFNQLGKRAKEMDNLPLRMRRDIDTFLTNIDLQANLLDKMSKTMDTCIVGQQTGSWIG